jgi:phenylpropionate dioxygenase-like ring-hydroxylating dioxygenase large terminal subunit
MFRDHWYAILDSRELKRGRPVGVRRLGEQLVVWRSPDGGVRCVADKCAHRGASLAAGCVAGDRVRCPFHGLEFDGDGRCTTIPANGRAAAVPENFRVASYPAREAHGFVWIWWGEARESLPELPFFADLVDGFSYAGCAEPWAVHFTRAVENQLDIAHLPFVHHNTIGRGGRTLMHGPLVRVEGGDIKFWVMPEVDRGQPVLKPAEFPAPKEGQFHVHFRFPNLWQNWIAPKLRIFLSFTPVDDGNTVLYMRYYQAFARAPLLRNLVNRVGLFYSKVILHQDRRVVLTQQPRRTWLKMGENLLQADLPIVEFRRMCEGRIQAAGGTARHNGSAPPPSA